MGAVQILTAKGDPGCGTNWLCSAPGADVTKPADVCEAKTAERAAAWHAAVRGREARERNPDGPKRGLTYRVMVRAPGGVARLFSVKLDAELCVTGVEELDR